jgi:hypothetical protein
VTELSRLLKQSGKQTDNHRQSAAAKIDMRRHLFASIPNPRVFDAFAGAGKMHREVWHAADHYAGCDMKWYCDTRHVYVAKNQRVLRAVDLAEFNIFDFDAYGSPWEQVTILASRRRLRPGERIGLVLTDGSGLKLKMGQCPKALAALCNLAKDKIPGINRVHAMLIETALDETCRLMGGRIVDQWHHERPGSRQMRYLAVVIEGLS